MAQSLSRVLLHIIYSTKNRVPMIDAEIAPGLHAYQSGIYKACGCPALTINSEKDHIHALCLLSRTLSISDLLEEVKKGSSKWMKTKGARYGRFAWQAGYGAFSIGQSQVDAVAEYIAGQAQHHRRRTFQEEFRLFLKRYQVAYDERYVWN